MTMARAPGRTPEALSPKANSFQFDIESSFIGLESQR